MRRFNLSGWAVSHPALILFLVVALGAAGFFSYQKLGRAEDPFFTVKVVNVSVIWPGATAAEIQTQVADPIEKKLQELPFFEKVQTYSKPAFTAMQVTFKDSTPAKDVPYLFYLLRKKLVDVQGELPAGILGPVVNDEYSDVDSILYMMTGDGADYAQLKKAAEGMRQRLLKVPGVTKVDLYGAQDERIYVEFSHAKLATLGITPQALFDSLAKQNNVVPAGCSGWAISPPSPTVSSTRQALWCARKVNPRSVSGWSPPRAPISWSLARTSPTRPPNS